MAFADRERSCARRNSTEAGPGRRLQRPLCRRRRKHIGPLAGVSPPGRQELGGLLDQLVHRDKHARQRRRSWLVDPKIGSRRRTDEVQHIRKIGAPSKMKIEAGGHLEHLLWLARDDDGLGLVLVSDALKLNVRLPGAVDIEVAHVHKPLAPAVWGLLSVVV